MKQLNPLDASFYYRESPTEYQHISGFAIYDQSTVPDKFKQSNGEVLGFKDILRFMEKGLPISPVARRKLIPVPGNLDHPYWINDANFDLEYHIRHLALPKPGDWQQLCIMIARLHSRPLDFSRPLWEVYVIEGLDNIPGLPEGCFAVFSKTHHAAIDGASGAHLTSATHTLNPEDEIELPDDVEPWEPEDVPTPEQLLMRTHFRNLQKPMEAYEMYATHWPKLYQAQTKMLRGEYSKPREAPQTRFNGVVSANRVFDGRAFDLEDFKSIRHKVKSATINDVVLTVVGGAWRKYLESIDELPDDPLVALVPINVRTEEEAGSGGNLVAGMTAHIGTHIADPIERLDVVSKETKASKEMTNAVGARTMLEFQGLTPAAMAALGARTASAHAAQGDQVNPTNMTITNVPGVQVPIYLSGAQAMVTFGLGPIGNGCGVFISAQSYSGLMTISITADRDMMEHPARFAGYLDEAFAELKTSVLGEVEASSKDVINLTVARDEVRSDKVLAPRKTKTVRRVPSKPKTRTSSARTSSKTSTRAAAKPKAAPKAGQAKPRAAAAKTATKPAQVASKKTAPAAKPRAQAQAKPAPAKKKPAPATKAAAKTTAASKPKPKPATASKTQKAAPKPRKTTAKANSAAPKTTAKPKPRARKTTRAKPAPAK